MTGCFSPILVTLALVQVPGGVEYVSVKQKEGRCDLRDFGGRPDGWLEGIRMWFGVDLVLKTSWYVASTSWNHNRNCIYAGGMIRGSRNADLYFCYNVGFFDADDNLIACGSDFLAYAPGTVGVPCVLGPVKDLDEVSVTCIMPIPTGVHRSVAHYKVAYYESKAAIGKAVWDEHKAFPAEASNGDTGRTTASSLSRWKSDGELRGSPFRVQTGSRLLPMNAQDDWQAETTEGTCSLRRAAAFNSDEERVREFSVAVGNALGLKADCRFKINQDNAIETWVRFKNASDKARFGELYIAFFDRQGNLVGSNHTKTSTEPNGTMPSVTIGGRRQPNASAYEMAMPIPVPFGLEKSITSYKMTLYESERLIGENRTQAR